MIGIFRLCGDLYADSRITLDNLKEGMRDNLERLLANLLKRHGLHEEIGLVVLHGLHHAETHLRFRPVAAVVGLSWEAFRASLLVHVAKDRWIDNFPKRRIGIGSQDAQLFPRRPSRCPLLSPTPTRSSMP